MKYCHSSCTSEAYIRAGDSVASSVFTRDKGVCAKCGMDTTDEIFHDMYAVKRSLVGLYREPLGECPFGKFEFKKREGWINKERYPKWIRDQWGPWWRIHNSLWEADHIIPVKEGGGCCGIDNYQTLCLRCHKEDTKALAGRTSRRKRAEKRMVGPQMELAL